MQITSGAFTTSTTLSQFVSYVCFLSDGGNDGQTTEIQCRAVSGYLAQDSDCVLTGNGDDDDDDFFYATTPERIATIVILIALIGCVGVAVWSVVLVCCALALTVSLMHSVSRYHQRKRKQEQQQMQSHAADVLLHDMEPDSASEENRFTLQ